MKCRAVLLLAALLAACSPKPEFRATEFPPLDWGKDVTLTAHTGKRVSTADYRGKVLVLFFGYTQCPDICAPTVARLAQAVKALGDEAARVQVFFVTLDPKRDTAAQLAAFVPRFHPSFLGLTGSDAELAAVAREYKVAYAGRPDVPGIIDHYGGIFIKDASGRLRLLAKNDAPPENLAHDLRLLLREAATATSL